MALVDVLKGQAGKKVVTALTINGMASLVFDDGTALSFSFLSGGHEVSGRVVSSAVQREFDKAKSIVQAAEDSGLFDLIADVAEKGRSDENQPDLRA